MSNTCAARTGTRRHRRPAGAGSATGVSQTRLSSLELVALLVIVTLMVVGVLSSRSQAPHTDAMHVVQVQSGETLWSVAKTHPVDGFTTAQTSEAIARLNNLPSSTLTAGQTLLVPSRPDNGSQVAAR